MTSQGSASGRFTRAIQQRNLFAAEVALREMGNPSLMLALDYVILLAELHMTTAEARTWIIGGERTGRPQTWFPDLPRDEQRAILRAAFALLGDEVDRGVDLAIRMLEEVEEEERPQRKGRRHA
jgi:hypothetical protein